LAEATGGKMKESDIPEIAKIAVEDIQNAFNPRPFTVEMYTDMMKKMLSVS